MASLFESLLGQAGASNPLSGFGFTSPEEQQVVQDQQAMQAAQLSPLQMSVYQAQKSSNRITASINKIINGSGSKTSGAIKQFNQVAASNQGDLAKSLQEMGKSLIMQGDPRGIAMVQQGKEMQLKQDKAALDVTKTQADITNTQNETVRRNAGQKLGDTRQIIHGENQVQQEVVGFDSTSGAPIYKDVGDGPRSPKQTIQTIDDPRTQSQKGKDLQDFRDQAINTEAAIKSMRTIKENLRNGAAQGWAGGIVNFLSNASGTLSQLAPGASLDAGATRALNDKMGNFQEWAIKTGVNSAIWADLVSNLAKTYSPSGTITEKDINRAAEAVGASYSNPKAVAAVLDDVEKRSIESVDRAYGYATEETKKSGKYVYDTFKKFANGKLDKGITRLPSGATIELN